MKMKQHAAGLLLLALLGAGGLTSPAPAATSETTSAPRDINQTIIYTMQELTDRAQRLDMARQAHSEALIRGWFKWHEARRIDPLRAITEQAHAFGALFGGGITCSALYDGENGITRQQLEDMATRGPDGKLVDAWGQRGIRHGSLSSPAYQDYLFRWCREQIDAGVDILFMDENNAALRPNEGYDDYSLADFRRHLLADCPRTHGWGAADPRWNSELKIDLADHAIAPDGTMNTFDYRAWLRAHNLAEKPVQLSNALNPLWQDFRKRRDDRVWKALTDRIRAYAAGKNRKVLISGNGLSKYVDLQVLGVWGQWSTRDGHIELRESKIPYWRETVRRGRVLAGRRVPVVLFHDWGFGNPPFPWMAIPPSEREVWMRTAGAEIFAAGAFFAFPVLGPNGCDAGRDGTLPAIGRQAAFYQEHRDLYLDADCLGGDAPRSETPNLSLAVWARKSSRDVILHAINRNVTSGTLHPQKNVTVTLPLGRVPDRAVLISPDFAEERPVKCRMSGGRLEIALGDLDAYDVAILRYDREIAMGRLRDPARTLTSNQWIPSERREFRILPDGAIENAEELGGVIHGMLHKQWRNPPTFLVNAARAGEFKAHVRAVATLGARLEWRIDGQPRQAAELPDLDHKNTTDATEYDKTVSFPIPAGRHRLTLDNTGGDWASVNWVALTGDFKPWQEEKP